MYNGLIFLLLSEKQHGTFYVIEIIPLNNDVSYTPYDTEYHFSFSL